MANSEIRKEKQKLDNNKNVKSTKKAMSNESSIQETETNSTKTIGQEAKANSKEANIKEKSKNNQTTKKSRIRMILVIIFILLFILVSYIILRGSYLEYKELGEAYVQEFFTNLKFKYSIMGINFIFLYILIYFTNRGIKKGLKQFFDKEKKPMPKILNKSIALVISVIVSAFMSSILTQKVLLCFSNASFRKTDPIFSLDISYYIFQKPLIDTLLTYFMGIMIVLTIYMAVYYIIVLNRYLDGVDRECLRESIFVKKIIRNVMIIAIIVGITTILNTQNILFGKITTIDNSETTTINGESGDIELTGANYTDAIIQRWGYTIFGILIIICVWRAISSFKKKNTKNVIISLGIIPLYLVILFLVMVSFDLIFVNSNRLDKERDYIAKNIENTKNAYNINVEEISLENSGTITQEEVEENQTIIDNIPIVTEDVVLSSLKANQTGTGYYSYRSANLATYEINGENRLCYVSPREILNSGRTYSNKTYEYTHGMGQILTSASTTTENGNVEYIQKEVSGEDDKLNTKQQRIYFGLETNDYIATNTKNKQEYDYTSEDGVEHTSTYQGNAGLNLSFIDRLILGITKGDLQLAFSVEITEKSKILLNRNIIDRAKKAMPYLLYDEEPYTVVTEEGKIVWVLDAYTVSSNYPYSQYTTIEYENKMQRINYIRNSVKVIIDAYDGTIEYYITDETDPIAMAYSKMYEGLFKKGIPEDISKHFKYPKYLYNVQSELLKTYHNDKVDIIYRADDIWDFAKYNSTRLSSSTGTILEPYYIMVKDGEEEKLGLIQIYTPNGRQNLISYLVGETEGETNKLKLYKFSEDSNIIGPMQLEQQIEQDEAISAEIDLLDTTGMRVTKQMIVVPIENTLLYIEPVYQTVLNDPANNVPTLKKVIVASGNKVAIGNTLEQALNNLLSRYAVDIEIENTEDIEGLIESIIRANNNLKESSQNSNWEMIGSDIQRLQELIDSLEKMKQEEEENQTNEENQINEEIQANEENNVDETGNIIDQGENGAIKTKNETNNIENGNI